jgi:glycosyltransferase involved in cell wall biosynthesis
LVLITTRAAVESPQFQLHLAKIADCFRIEMGVEPPPRSNSPLASWRHVRSVGRVVERIAPDHLYLPYGDQIVAGAALDHLSGWRALDVPEAEVLLLRGGFRYPPENAAQRVMAAIGPRLVRAGGWARVHHLNPDDWTSLQSLGGNFAERCHLMADPIEAPCTLSRTEARRKLGIPEDGRYIGCTGLVDRRKGMDRLLRAFQQCEGQLRADDRLLLAGPIQQEIHELLQREYAADFRRRRVVLIDRHFTVEEIAQAVAALDVVCTPYPKHRHSASIVIRAASHERFVLGNANWWMGRTIREFGLGSTCNVLDESAFAAAIPVSLAASESFHLGEKGRRFAKFHSAENFAAQWRVRLRERLGLPPDPNILAWDWVLAAPT